MSAPVAALNSFRTNTEDATYDILRVDANGVGQGYSSGEWSLDDAKEVMAHLAQAEWNKHLTFHIVKRVVTETYEIV